MSREELLRKLPAGGFLKRTQAAPAHLSAEQRTALIRKGNDLLNKGEIALAQRIFVTTRYADGLARVGDLLLEQNKPLEALEAYRLASCREKASTLVERIARVMSGWLKEEGKPDHHE